MCRRLVAFAALVAVEAAMELGASEFAFLLAVMFASAIPFMTPVGHQTNLLVYGPGGYTSGDSCGSAAPSRAHAGRDPSMRLGRTPA